MNLLSIDAETNGLWGKAFAIAATFNIDGIETKTFLGRCPINEPISQWVAENVLPQMSSIPENHSSYEKLLEDFCKFYLENKEGADIIVHMGLPVEARLFIDAHNLGFMGDWDAPFPLIDIAAALAIRGEDATSVDTYNRKHGIEVPSCDGEAHNPLYDCRAASLCWMHMKGILVVTHLKKKGICERCGGHDLRYVCGNHMSFYLCHDCGHANPPFNGG